MVAVVSPRSIKVTMRRSRDFVVIEDSLVLGFMYRKNT